MDLANRRHLANMRVVQKNLVYIIGLHPKLATEEIIRSPEYFGHFGKIAKIVINKRQIAPTSHANGAVSMQPSAAIYVTYVRKDDAAKAIHAVDGSVMAGRILRASYGTTKYCTYYLRNMSCPNPNCLYLHEPGEDADTISKEELATGKHRMRDQISHDNPEDDNHDYTQSPSLSSASIKEERSALPATASWGKLSTPGTPTTKHSGLPERALTPDAFGPPLAVAVAQQQQQQQQQQKHQLSPSVLKRKLEKKKRKELERQKKQQVQEHQHQHQHGEEQKKRIQFDDLVQFVLGDAFDQLCFPGGEDDDDEYEEDEEPVGVSGLYEDNEKRVPIQQLRTDDDDDFSLEKLNLEDFSPLEYLTRSIPMPSYTGTFNPFSHQLMREQQQPLFDSPARKTSRFGFAQF